MFEPIIDMLAFLGSQKDYSYIDRLGNALDEISILEAIRDAMRAFYATCGSEGTNCPQIDAQKLQDDVNILTSIIQNKPRFQVLQLARELSLKSYARIKNFELSTSGKASEKTAGA